MDDETILQELVGAMLDYLGYEVGVRGARRGGAGPFQEARTAGRPFSAVIVDLTVPGGMGGHETVQRLRELDPGVRAIVSSGYSNDPIIANYRSTGSPASSPSPTRWSNSTRCSKT